MYSGDRIKKEIEGSWSALQTYLYLERTQRYPKTCLQTGCHFWTDVTPVKATHFLMFTSPGCPATNPYVRVLIFYVSTLCLAQAQLVHYRQTPSPFQVPFSSPKSQSQEPRPLISVPCPQVPGVPRSQIDLKRRLRWETSCSKCCRWGDCEFCTVLGVYRRCHRVFARFKNAFMKKSCCSFGFPQFGQLLPLFLTPKTSI